MNPGTRRPDRWHDGFGRVATRSAQLLLVVAVVTLVGYLGVTLRLVVVPVLIAVLLAAAASPLVDRLARGMPRLAAVWITILLAVLVLGGAGWAVGDSVAEQAGELRDGALQGFEQLEGFIASGPFGLPATDPGNLTERLSEAVQGSTIQSGAVTGATAVAQVLTGLVLAAVVFFFLLKDGRTIWSFFVEQLPEREHHRFELIGQRSAVVLGGYVRGTACVALIDAVLIGIGLVLVGVPLALPLALLVFITAFVPVVGAVAAGVVATLITLALNGPTDALIVLAIVIVVNQIEGNFLQPILMGRYLSLHPLVILLALTAGSIVAGIIGAILAVPFAAVAWAAVQASRQAHADHEHELERQGVGDGPDEGRPSSGLAGELTAGRAGSTGSTGSSDGATGRDGGAPGPRPAGTTGGSGARSAGGGVGVAERARPSLDAPAPLGARAGAVLRGLRDRGRPSR